jgi:FkbM family methyltransferase
MIKKKLASLLISITPKKIKQIYSFELNYKIEAKFKFSQLAYSQEGEDLVLNRLFDNKHDGFYVDVGANHPLRFSNTHFFYKKGWRGVNIEPNPELHEVLQDIRKEDANINLGVSTEKGELDYYMFNEPALNTFSKKEADEYLFKQEYSLIKKCKVKVDTLEAILDNIELIKNKSIDFMSIDAEGFDLKVLASNSFEKYAPKVVLIEILGIGKISEVFDNEVYVFLIEKGYDLYLRTGNTFIFKK